MLKQTFLGQLLKNDKITFALIVLFILGQTFVTWRGVEWFPFLNYGMYSGKALKADTVEVIALKLNGKQIDISRFPHMQFAITQSTFNWYAALKQNNFSDTISKVFDTRFKDRISDNNYHYLASKILNDSVKVQTYPTWLMHYLQNDAINIEGNIIAVAYNKSGELDSLNSKQIFSYGSNK
ncbi:MAG: hypothetical protein KF706_02070 [Chitinophagales bacterium]|nr:hypothetical protein [Chitinophagales bacterium]HRN94636.1 hypothetical protein [Chitinophagales bacterium]HRP38416.1 hypothetical protein [Chitinophagales bacterium]